MEFLIEDSLNNGELVALCEGKSVKLNYDHCYLFEVHEGKVKKHKFVIFPRRCPFENNNTLFAS